METVGVVGEELAKLFTRRTLTSYTVEAVKPCRLYIFRLVEDSRVHRIPLVSKGCKVAD